MNYRDRIARLQREAEAKFRNFDGITYARPFRNAAGGLAPTSTEVLDANDSTWTFTVVNAATTAKTVVLFGAAKDLTDANKDASVTITVAEAASHVAVKTELLSQPVRILGLKMTAVSAVQFSNVLYLYDGKTTGSQIRRLFQPLNYRSSQQTLQLQIDAPTFELLVTPTVWLEFVINASETVTLMFHIVEKASFSNVLRNAPVVAVANQPAPTGLVQIDQPRGV